MPTAVLTPAATPVLRRGDAANLPQVCEAIYATTLRKGDWTQALLALRRFLAVDCAVLVMEPNAQGVVRRALSSPAAEPAYREAYRDRYESLDPLSDLALDAVHSTAEQPLSERWQRFYRDFAVQLDCCHGLGARFATEAGTAFRLKLFRGRQASAFDDGDVQQVQALLPHLRTALSLLQQQDRADREREVYADALGALNVPTLVLDGDARLLSMNAAARRLVGDIGELEVVGDALHVRVPRGPERFEQMLDRARRHPQRSAAMQLGAAWEAQRWTLFARYVADGDAVAGLPAWTVFVRSAGGRLQLSADVLRELFHLTPTETQVAQALVNGASVDEAAAGLGMRVSTARGHLSSIFTKTGVNRQVELVQLLLQGGFAFSSADAVA